MNNKRNDSVTEFGGYQWPAVFEYKADDALFVLCETEDDELYHIKLKFDSIVSILATSGNNECIITALDGKFTAHAPLADIIACLPQSKFAKIHWNEVLNLSLVDRIDGNIFYVGRASYSVDRRYVEDVHRTFCKVEKGKVEVAEPSSYYDSIFLRVGECYRRVSIEAIMWIESYHNMKTSEIDFSFSLLYFVISSYHFGFYSNFCFFFVTSVLLRHNPILIINVLQQISRFSRKR